MRNLRAALIVVVGLMGLAAAPAGAVVTKTASGHRISLMLRSKLLAARKASSGPVLINHGGPVMTSEAPYLIFWTPPGHSIATSSQSLLEQYLGDVAADSATNSTDNVYSVLKQYNAPYSQTFDAGSQTVLDGNQIPTNQGPCPIGKGMTACVTDASLRAEIANLIANHQLPQPGSAGPTPIFVMVTPVDVNICTNGKQCASNKFCAYHDFFAQGSNHVLYASVPFSVFATSTKGCQTDGLPIYETPVGSSGDQAYNVADDMSHELSETITDPLINAWFSKAGLEVADLCEAYAPTANTNKGLSPLAYAPAFGDADNGVHYDQVISGDQYYNQTEFSNSDNRCRTGVTDLPPQ